MLVGGVGLMGVIRSTRGRKGVGSRGRDEVGKWGGVVKRRRMNSDTSII